MDTNGAGTEFSAVEHHVVGFRAAMRGIGGEFFEILIVYRSERVMRGVPAALFFVPFKHGEIDYPQETEILRVEQLMTIVIFLPGLQTQMTGGQEHGVFGELAFNFAAPAAEHQQVIFSSAGTLADFGHGGGKVALKTLGIVENTQAALLAKGFKLVALLAAHGSGFGYANGHQRQAFGRQALAFEQVLDAMEGREAQIRLIAAIGTHSLRVGEARHRNLHLNAGRLHDGLQHALDHFVDGFLLREGHLQIDLGKFGLPIGAQVLIAEAAHDLEIFVEARDHQQLFEDLRRLRQRVEVAWADPRGNQIVARAFRCGAGHKRRLDFEKALASQLLAHSGRYLRTQNDVVLHAWAAQIDVAVFKARVFLDVHVVFHGEGRRARLVQDPELFDHQFHLSGGNGGIDILGGAQCERAFGGEDIFGGQKFGLLVHVRFGVFVEDQLSDAFAIAQVNENHSAQIAAAM